MTELVRFKIPGSRISKSSSESEAYREIIEKVFGETLGRANWHQDVVFICRSDQFVQFLLMRHERSLCNRFAELDVKIIEMEDQKKDLVFRVDEFRMKPR